jgi:uncharacterized membrane protein YjdF
MLSNLLQLRHTREDLTMRLSDNSWQIQLGILAFIAVQVGVYMLSKYFYGEIFANVIALCAIMGMAWVLSRVEEWWSAKRRRR